MFQLSNRRIIDPRSPPERSNVPGGEAVFVCAIKKKKKLECAFMFQLGGAWRAGGARCFCRSSCGQSVTGTESLVAPSPGFGVSKVQQ